MHAPPDSTGAKAVKAPTPQSAAKAPTPQSAAKAPTPQSAAKAPTPQSTAKAPAHQPGPHGLPELRYDCALQRLPSALASRFVGLHFDAEAEAFTQRFGPARHGGLRTAAFRGLRHLMSDFDAYGLLNMYRVHLLSQAQLSSLLSRPPDNTADGPAGALLDIGAGNGDAMAPARALFAHWHATEASRVMRRRLRARGAHVHELDLGQSPMPAQPGALAAGFDLVACLNLIDRTRYPMTLLRHARAALRPGGRLLLSVPLPLRPHVDVGRYSVDQEEPLPLPQPGDSWETAAARVAERVLRPAGFEVASLSRLPYLCQGDARAPWHVLDDVLFVSEPVV